VKFEFVKSSGLSIRKCLLSVFYLTLAVFISAQENYIRFDRISSEQGLSLDTVTCILQDNRGFMWFGTQYGLNRFDGYVFKKYINNPKDHKSLPANIVTFIYEDNSGNFWIGTEGGGLSLFNHEKESFIRIPYQNDSDPNPTHDINIVITFHEDPSGVYWVGTWGGLLRFDSNEQKWTRFFYKPGVPGTLSDSKIMSFCQDQQGIMWIGTVEGGLNAFNPQTGEFTPFFHQTMNKDYLNSNSVYAILEDSKQNLWIGTKGGLYRFDRKTKKFIYYQHHDNIVGSLSNNWIRTIFEDSKGRLWIGTERGGLNQLKSLSEGTIVSYRHQPNNPHSLSHNTVYSIIEDRSGCIWIGTFGGGINLIDPQMQQFGHIIGNFGHDNSLIGNQVQCFFEDSDTTLWIGTSDNGLRRYNPATGKYKYYKHSSLDPRSLSSNDMTTIYKDKECAIWIGTWGGGINRFNREDDTFTRYKFIEGNNKGPSSNYIFCFYEDPDNNLWIGTWQGGLNLFLREKSEFIYFKNDPLNPKSISYNGVTSIYPDKKHEEFLWVGTHSGGIERFNRYTGNFEHYPHDPDNPNSLSHNSVLSIYISPHNPDIVWVGTNGGGINKFNQKTNQWQFYTEEDGLCNNTICGILEDKNRNLWLSTFKGLSRFNPEKGDFKNYYAEDGLQHNEFNHGAFYKGKDGRFYFGGINGFNAFIPEHISDNTHIPPVVFTEFKVLNREDFQLEKSILETKELRLSYKDTFSFEFAALNYTASSKNQYAYKLELEGSDNKWVQLKHKRDITFSTLSPGKYVFRIKGSNNDGIWNEEGASLKIIITPPFWSTWWFRVLLGFTALGTLLVMYKLRVRRYKIQRRNLETEVSKRTREIRKQKDIIEEKNIQLEVSNRELKKSEGELRELNATKDKFFSIISHDLRNHLTALLGFSDMLYRSFQKMDDGKKEKYSHSIDRAAKDLYDLLENLLQWARTQTGVLQCKPKTFDLSSLIPEIISTYNINAKKKNINLSWKIRKSTYAYADKNMIRTVMRNLISNAIKFTEKNGEILVTANGKDGFVEVSILDSGVGISRESKDTLFKIGKTSSTRGTAKEKGTGLGLIICKEFVEKNNGRIWFESPVPDGSEKGSIFYFTLPLPGTPDQ
jgi:signal transduction histidine kinase/ligand-binding sensor domain-containing protein